MRITILHPFTPEAVGLSEKELPTIHSQPHVKALQILLKQKGYECSMEYFTSTFRKYKINASKITYTFYPVKFRWSGDHKKWKKQSSGSCLRSYRKQTPDVTIINMSGHSSPFSFELSKIIRNNDKQYIAMVGGQHYSDNERNSEFYKKANHILVHTQSQKVKMLKLDLFKDADIRVFPLGVDCTTFIPKTNRTEFPQLLYVGRIVELKRIHLAIEALKKLVDNGFPGAHLNIIGPISSKSYFIHLKELVLKLKLEKNVSFLGQIEHGKLVDYYQKADLFLLPSKMESFGMVMVEAMACGTPVAAINFSGGPEEIIDHGKNGILASPEDYNEEILEFFKNMNYAQEMSIKAREKVVASYSLNATYRVLEGSVNSVLKSRTIN